MSREIELKFPLGGYDANWGYSAQPEGTTPACRNVRGYSTDSRRARGGSRPGLRRAYAQQIGGPSTPIQWLGWLDYGFGDSVLYADRFEYADGTLSGEDNWTGSDPEVKVKDGYVHLEGALPLSDKAAAYDAFSGDTWDDFSLECGLQWRYGSTGQIALWVSSTADSATDGAKVTVGFTSTEVASPGLGFQGALQITLESGSNLARHTRSYGIFFAATRGRLRVEADQDAVRAFWDGQEVAVVARDDGACDEAGFKMSVSNPVADDWFPDAMVDFRLLDWELAAMTRPTSVSRKLVAVAGRGVWAESSEGTMAAAAEDTDQLADVSLISAARCNGALFLVDGAQPRYYTPVAATDKVQAWSPRKGEIVKTCRAVVNYRNRLVLFGAPEDPQNYWMSRQGDPWDFDTGPDDPNAAVTGGQSDLGRIGDPITALCPVSDELLVIGCTRSIWVLRGDPAQGGYVTRHSDQTGILGDRAWTTDPQGALYFLGEEGLYVMPPGGRPTHLTRARLPELGGYQAVPPAQTGAAGQSYVSLAYDAARHGVLLFLTPYSAAEAVHYFYDLRNDAFWPESYPQAMGPTVAAYYSAASGAYRKLLLGGRDGYLYEFADDAAGDVEGGGSTSAIDSYVWIGARRFGGPLHDALVTGITATLSADSDDVTYGVHAADTAEALCAQSSSEAAATGTWSAGRNAPDRTRVRGGAHAVKLSNDTAGRAWALESVAVEVAPGGPQR